jgi:hypothetical protein
MSYLPKNNRISIETENYLRDKVKSVSKGMQESYKKSAESFIDKVRKVKKRLNQIDSFLVNLPKKE